MEPPRENTYSEYVSEGTPGMEKTPPGPERTKY